MDEKKIKTALILDTNVILSIGIKKFEEVYNKLAENYDVYIPEMAILERVSQKNIETKKAFDAIAMFKSKYGRYVTVSNPKHIDYYYKVDKNITEKGYKDLANEKIIPHIPDKECFTKVIERVMLKIPPFYSDGNASDKGFKDTLMWLSILEYKNKLLEYENVKFVTNDGGFTKHEKALKAEYNDLNDNDNDFDIVKSKYIDDILNNTEPLTPETDIPRLQVKNIDELRENIDIVTNKIICFEEHDYNYGEYYEKYFEINTILNNDDVSNILESLRINIQTNYLSKEIYPHLVFEGIDIISKFRIPINDLEEFLSLYETVINNNPDILPQFITAVCDIFNENYVEKKPDHNIDEEDMPF